MSITEIELIAKAINSVLFSRYEDGESGRSSSDSRARSPPPLTGSLTGLYPVYPTSRNFPGSMIWKLSVTVSRISSHFSGRVEVKKRITASAKLRKSGW